MLVVGLTGGIGSGKSTVARSLAERGAIIIDTDVIAREVVAPGEAAHEAVAERFGEEFLDETRAIDRAALGALVFADAQALADLEAIIHPAVQQIVNARLAAESSSDHVVVLEVPLLIHADGTSRYETAGILVVDAPEDVVIERLVRDRGMSKEDARARIAAQVPRETRLRAANFIIMNMGSLVELDVMVDESWRWIETLGVSGASTNEPAPGA